MKLYGHEDSGHAYKVALTLQLANIDHDYQRVDINQPRETRSAEFLAASKWAEVPCLVNGDVTMIQSGAILLMLAREYNALNSKDKIDACAEWINWEANRIGMCIPQLLWALHHPEDVNAGAREWLLARFKVDHDRLSDALSDQDFLLGELSVADICVYGYVSKAQMINLPLSENITRWKSRIEGLVGFQSAQTLLGV